jgi:hypothetical protein
MPLSHVSPISTAPFPQTAAQSLSLFRLHPGAQQPSPFVHVTIGGYVHCTLHWAGAPVRRFVVHAFMSSQVAGQVPSQVSGGSTVPLPQVAEQSVSFAKVQPVPVGQQPSPDTHAVTGGCVQSAVHSTAVPAKTSIVQAFPSSAHDAGQLPSQISGGSMIPSPHAATHWASAPALQPGGQQMSSSPQTPPCS